MRILYLLTQDLNSPSGLGRYWPIARAMAARGHQVDMAMLHSNWGSIKEKQFTRDGVNIYYAAPMHVMKNGDLKEYYSTVSLIFVTLRATSKLFTIALKAKTDIIHICKPHPMNSLAGIFAAKIRGKKLCIDCDDYEAGSNRFNGKWQQYMVAFFEKKTPTLSNLITTNSHFMKSKLIEWGCSEEKIYYLQNGYETDRFTLQAANKVGELRTALQLDGNQVILFVGSLSKPSHPVDLLLKAFKIVNNQIPKTKLLIVGGGEEFNKLQDQAKSLGVSQNTSFTGRVDPSIIATYYALADVSTDPVYDDDVARGRSPLKLFESWISGVPFITSPVGDRKYLLGTPPAGKLVEPAGDAYALANGILEVLNSNSLASDLRSRGLSRAQDFSWEKLVIGLEQQYLNLL